MKSVVFKRSERLIKNLETLLLNLQSKDESYEYKRLYRFFLNEKYYTQPVRPDLISSLKDETYQAQKNDPVEKLLTAILSAAYLTSFSKSVHSGILNRNAHTCLSSIREDLGFYPYYLYFDLNDLITNIDYRILDFELSGKIHDERLIRLVNKFVKTVNFSKDSTYSRTLAENEFSDLLINIYLHPLDRIMDSFNISWVRYRGALLIGLCEWEKNNRSIVIDTLYNTYNYETNPIFKRSGQRIRFLEYDVHTSELGPTLLQVPQDVIKSFILKKDLVKDIDQKPWKSKHRGYLLNLTDEEIFRIYNSELKNFYQYYSIASNVSRKFGQLKYIMETSCLKTLARKHRTTMNNIKEKYRIGDSWGINQVPFYKGFKTHRPNLSPDIDNRPQLERNKKKNL